MSLRPLFHQFIRRIHPDLLPGVPEAKSANTLALQHLNHFLDHLESSETSPNPLTGQSLPLFLLKANGRLRPSSLRLPAVPPSADFLEKREIALGLSAELGHLLQEVPAVNRGAVLGPEVEPLLDRGPEGWKSLFDQEMRIEQTKQLLYSPATKQEAYKQYLTIKIKARLERKYKNIKNKISRNLKLKKLDSIVDYLVKKRLHNTCDTRCSIPHVEETHVVKIASLGYNPHFVFFARDLTPVEVRQGLVCLAGEGLTSQPDKWLLENIFRALRCSDPPVPVVLGRKFSANSEFGFLEIPYEFQVSALADFVDEWLDEVRDTRSKILHKIRAK